MKGHSKNTVLTIGAVLVFVAVLYAFQNNSRSVDGFQAINTFSSALNIFGVDLSKYSWWQKILYYLAMIVFFIFCLIFFLFILLVAGGQRL